MDINRASAEELERTGQIDGTRAGYLVEHRSRSGPFHSWDEVKQVPSFEEGMVERLQGAGFTIGGSGNGASESRPSRESSGEGRGGARRHDLNRASADELTETHMIDGERAERLIAFRRSHGEFKDWEEIKSLPGFDDGLVNRLQEAGFEVHGAGRGQ